jgi:hypothetical protein
VILNQNHFTASGRYEIMIGGNRRPARLKGERAIAIRTGRIKQAGDYQLCLRGAALCHAWNSETLIRIAPHRDVFMGRGLITLTIIANWRAHSAVPLGSPAVAIDIAPSSVP